MKNLIYQTIKKRLQEEGNIKHVALWNQQVQFIEQEQAFDTPAIFVEFGTIEWSEPHKSPIDTEEVVQRAKGTITLHIVTNAYSYNDEQTLALTETVNKQLKGLTAENGVTQFGRWTRNVSTTNHNHDELVESLETFQYQGTTSY